MATITFTASPSLGSTIQSLVTAVQGEGVPVTLAPQGGGVFVATATDAAVELVLDRAVVAGVVCDLDLATRGYARGFRVSGPGHVTGR